MTDADVLCIIQEKNGKRWLYGSGELKTMYDNGSLKKHDSDSNFVLEDNQDEMIVEPSPDKLMKRQTFLPSSLRNVDVTVTSSAETQAATFTPVLAKKVQKKTTSNSKKGKALFESKETSDKSERVLRSGTRKNTKRLGKRK